MNVNTFGIYFVIGYLVGGDLARLIFWRLRIRRLR